MGGGAADARPARRAGPQAAPEVRPRRGARAAARLLPPQPAEHVHRRADRGDDGRGAAARPRARFVKRYAEVLRVPHVATLIAATLIARFPIGINALALILYLRHATGSFAVAGVVAGGLAAGAGVGAPVQGRLVDTFGQRRVLVPLAFVHATALGSVVAFAELGAPTVVLVACSVSAGFAIPPTSSVLRSMWPTLLRDREELLQPAYALDSVLIELIFILGPLLTAVLTAALSPASALLVSVASVITG